MKKFITLLVTIMCLLVGAAQASHLAGGQITYKFVSTGNNNQHTYKVEVVLFGDCSGGTFSTFANTASVGLNVYNNSNLVTTVFLPKIVAESDVLISPVCPTAINQTTCTGGALAGIKKFTFRGDIVLNGASSDWRFSFNGNQYNAAGTTVSSAGRSGLIDNVTGATGTTMYLTATLNNMGGQNNSPDLTSEPTPFFCVTIPSSYGVAAVAPDLDDMSFSLVPGLTNALATTFVTYAAGYTAATPLFTAPGTFTFSTITGIMDFTPVFPPTYNPPYAAMVANRVTETRNGVVVGTCMREMAFVYLANCTNTAPSTPVGNVSNGELLQGTPNSVEFRVCEAQQVNFNYDITVTDPQGDNVTVTGTNFPQGAVLNVTNNGTPSPSVNIEWDLSTVPAGVYQFFVTYKDDGCPLSSVKTVTYTVYVQEFSGNFTTGFQEPCRNQSNGMAWIVPGATDTAKYKYTWMDPAFNILQTTPDLENASDTLFNLTPGVYLVEAENYRGCKRRFNIIVDSATYRAYFESDTVVCVNGIVQFNPNYDFSDFRQWDWTYGNGVSSTDSSPVVSYGVAGQYELTLVGTDSIGCKDTFSRVITVDSIMRPEFTLDRSSICVGEEVKVTTDLGNNAQRILWNFGDGGTLATEALNRINYAYPTPGAYNLNMKVSYRSCPDVEFTRLVTVNDFPKVSLGIDQGLCYQGQPIELKNLQAGQAGDRYLWNTGETLPVIYANKHGVHSLTVTRNDCATTDSVNILKDCYIDLPNAFTPGSGDESGYFLPRSILSKGVQAFDMTIFNRWGEMVFQSFSTNGRGWDGTMNGKDQPTGVYVYRIKVTYKDGKSETYNGNVTLLR